MKYDYNDAKWTLIESLLENYPSIEGDEIEAVVTHWLHSQSPDIPFLNDAMHEHCVSTLKPTDSKLTYLAEQYLSTYQYRIPIDWEIPFGVATQTTFKFIDLFAGIGGFRIAMQELGGECVFSSEWDPYAKKTYEANFGEVPFGDIRKINENDVPAHDVLCAGFPCQPFSVAGVSARNSLSTAHGFACETQGTLFFDIVRIIEAKRPKVVFLENVKNLVRHDQGKTFSLIRKTIESLGYSFSYKLLDASSLVPQRRVRCYMVCLRNGEEFEFPELVGPPLPLKSILEEQVDPSYTISQKLWDGHQRRTRNNLARGTGFTAFCADLSKPSNTLVARYGKDGKECLIPQKNKNPRMLTPRECARLQGFPDTFLIPVAKTAAYRQFGNSVAVPVIRLISQKILKYINTEEKDENEVWKIATR